MSMRASGMLKKQFEGVTGMTMMATACEWSCLMAPVAVHQLHLPPSVARAAGEIDGQLAADIPCRLGKVTRNRDPQWLHQHGLVQHHIRDQHLCRDVRWRLTHA